MRGSNLSNQNRLSFNMPRLCLKNVIIITSLFVFQCGLPGSAETGKVRAKNILVLHTAQSKRPWNMLFNHYLAEELGQSGLTPYNLKIESLDLLEFNNRFHKNTLKRMLTHKYSDHSPDIIIITFDEALKFLLENDLFPDTPKILISYSGTNFANTSNLAILLFNYDFKGDIEHCLSLLPDTKYVYVVAGHSMVDRHSVKVFANAVRELDGRVSFHYLTELDVDTLLNTVKALPPDAIIFYLSYSQNEEGNIYIAKDFCKQIGTSANRPVFTFFDIFVLNTGILGGRVSTTRSLANRAVEISKRTFQGEPVGIITTKVQPFEYIYDWNELKKWKIAESKLPPGSTILNKKLTFWGEYKHRILIGIIFIVLEAFLIVALLLNMNKRKQAEEEIRQMNTLLEQQVKARTSDLEGKNIVLAMKTEELEKKSDELEKKTFELKELNSFFVDRELKMVELKEDIAALQAQIEQAGLKPTVKRTGFW